MDPRLSGQTSIFGVVFCVSTSLLGIVRLKPRIHVRILTCRTWPIRTHYPASRLHEKEARVVSFHDRVQKLVKPARARLLLRPQ